MKSKRWSLIDVPYDKVFRRVRERFDTSVYTDTFLFQVIAQRIDLVSKPVKEECA